MPSRPTASRLSRLLGPRALAVLSCALALMAVEPVLGAAPASPAAKVAAISAPMVSEIPAMAARETRRTVAPARTAASYLATRRLHILATLEILHRLIAVELQPPVFQNLPAFITPPEMLTSVEPLRPLRTSLPQRAPPRVLSQQHAFLLTSTLLAPPIA